MSITIAYMSINWTVCLALTTSLLLALSYDELIMIDDSWTELYWRLKSERVEGYGPSGIGLAIITCVKTFSDVIIYIYMHGLLYWCWASEEVGSTITARGWAQIQYKLNFVPFLSLGQTSRERPCPTRFHVGTYLSSFW